MWMWLEIFAKIDKDGAHICAISLKNKALMCASNWHKTPMQILEM